MCKGMDDLLPSLWDAWLLDLFIVEHVTDGVPPTDDSVADVGA